MGRNNTVAPVNLGRKKQPNKFIIDGKKENDAEPVAEEVESKTPESETLEIKNEEAEEKSPKSEEKENQEKQEDVKESLKVNNDTKEKKSIKVATVKKGVCFTMQNILFLNHEILSRKVNYSVVMSEIIEEEKEAFDRGERFSEDDIFAMLTGSQTGATKNKKRINFEISQELEDFIDRFCLETCVTNKTEIFNSFVNRARLKKK